MQLIFQPKLLVAAVEEVAEKYRATSRASEEIIQNAALQRVAIAYEYALQYRAENKECCRGTLLHFLTAAGVSPETAMQIIDTDI